MKQNAVNNLTSNFSFSHSVLKRSVLQTHKDKPKGLYEMFKNTVFENCVEWLKMLAARILAF